MTELDTEAVAQRAAAATRLIRDAGALALDYFRRYRSLAVEAKTNPQDIVSEADRQVEQIIRRGLATCFPDDSILGEEHGLIAGSSEYTWLIDPIDGTSPFLHGLRNWCVVIALLHGDKPILGLIYDPSSKELFSAIVGRGAFLNDHPIRVDTQSSIGQGLTSISAVTGVSAAEVAKMIESLHNAGGAFIRLGSAALTLAFVAAGRLVGYYEPMLHSWDCVAGLLLVEEAGGQIRPFVSGHGYTGTGPAFAAAPQVYDDLAMIASSWSRDVGEEERDRSQASLQI